MLPALTSLLLLRGYGRLSASFMLLRAVWPFMTSPSLANHRFFTYFGEGHCRLSSYQAILEEPKRKQSIALAIISKTLLLGLPKSHTARFESLWVDQLVYTVPWRKHVSETTENLKQTMTWVSLNATVMVNMLTFSSQIFTLLG